VLTDRVAVVEAALDAAIDVAPAAVTLLDDDAVLRFATTLTAATARDLVADMVRSRALDVAARRLKAEGRGYYTISSAGHEHNAVVGQHLRTTDPAFLHYRSGAFMQARQRLGGVPVEQVFRDTLLSFMAAADDPVAGGRHKVWGSRDLWVPPQTSTIGSHPPKALGAAFAITRLRRLGIDSEVPHDAIVVCSLGDASANHATTLSAINATRWARRHGQPVPILFVIEDNGIGISVASPRDWIAGTFGGSPQLTFVDAVGDLVEVNDAVVHAVATCRGRRTPVLLRLPTVRLWGHAGSDVETAYRSLDDVERDEARDPLRAAVELLLAEGAASRAWLRALVDDTRHLVVELSAALGRAPVLSSAAAVIAPLAPFDGDATRREAREVAAAVGTKRRREHFGATLPEEITNTTRTTLGAHLNHALHDELLARPTAIVFGEDVGRKGGVYHVTAGLQRDFGGTRVFDTLLDETTILGTAQGAGLLGLLPIAEIQYLAYIHNALDQLRGEACSLQFFSAGQWRNPMVVRIAGWAYQRGFGGHFHNDNSIGALRDIPGLMIASPSRGDDAVRMLRGAVASAAVNGSVVAFVEPIALYHHKDLHEPGDGGWLTTYPAPGEVLLPGELGLHGAARGDADVLVVTYANGVLMALQAARELAALGIRVRVADLRWLAPLPMAAVVAEASVVGRVLVADEARATAGGIADAVIAGLVEAGFRGPMRSVRSADSYVPLGPAADHVLLHSAAIVAAAADLARQD